MNNRFARAHGDQTFAGQNFDIRVLASFKNQRVGMLRQVNSTLSFIDRAQLDIELLAFRYQQELALNAALAFIPRLAAPENLFQVVQYSDQNALVGRNLKIFWPQDCSRSGDLLQQCAAVGLT